MADASKEIPHLTADEVEFETPEEAAVSVQHSAAIRKFESGDISGYRN